MIAKAGRFVLPLQSACVTSMRQNQIKVASALEARKMVSSKSVYISVRCMKTTEEKEHDLQLRHWDEPGDDKARLQRIVAH